MGWFYFSAIIDLGFVIVLKYHSVYYQSEEAWDHAKIFWKTDFILELEIKWKVMRKEIRLKGQKTH